MSNGIACLSLSLWLICSVQLVWALEMNFKSSSSCGWDDDINDWCARTSTNDVFRVDLEDVQGIWWFIFQGIIIVVCGMLKRERGGGGFVQPLALVGLFVDSDVAQ